MKYICIVTLLLLSLVASGADQETQVKAVMSEALKEWEPENKYWYEMASMLEEPLRRDEAWAKHYAAALYNYGAGGYPKDHSRAWKLTMEAADAGYARAMFNLAVHLENGALNVEKDQAKALEWYKKGAIAGSRLAAGRVSEAYREGELGLKIDLSEAAKWEVIRGQCDD